MVGPLQMRRSLGGMPGGLLAMLLMLARLVGMPPMAMPDASLPAGFGVICHAHDLSSDDTPGPHAPAKSQACEGCAACVGAAAVALIATVAALPDAPPSLQLPPGAPPSSTAPPGRALVLFHPTGPPVLPV